MTYKSTARNQHFRAQQGSSSIRNTQRGYGGKSMFGAPLKILAGIKEQLDTVTARIFELPQLILDAPTLLEGERLRQELAAKMATRGQLANVLKKGRQESFSALFLSVAKSRLPRDLFLELIQETQALHTANGFDEFVPAELPKDIRRLGSGSKYEFRSWRLGQSLNGRLGARQNG